MKKIFVMLVSAAMMLSLAAPDLQSVVGQKNVPANNILARALEIARGTVTPKKYEQPISSETLYAVMAATGDLDARLQSAARASVNPRVSFSPHIDVADTQGCPNVFSGNGTKDIRVNQDCSLRRQAEEVVVANPLNPNNLIAGQNDSRIGFNHCGYDFSFDGGKTWGDQIPPFYQFLLGDGHVPDACSDPTATFDAQGNAYVGGLIFDVFSPANGIVVAKSNAGIGGAFYHSTQPGAFQEFSDLPLGVVANDIDPNIANDKEFIMADSHPNSPKANNVYATWTRFNGATGAGVGGNSPIYFSQSTDGGATWSPGIEISGSNGAICNVFSGESNPNACDQDQGSSPAIGADGAVYVAFGNGNTPNLNVNQNLLVKCPASADCSNPASWMAPVKVSDMIDTEPVGPDPNTGCSAGRGCLPPNGYRVTAFTSITANVDNNNNVYVTWSDFRNGGPNCNPNGPASTATSPCNNDVFYAFSTNGGASFGSTIDITPASKFGQTAQWQPWSAVTSDGSVLWVGFYDRSYGNCEATGCNDITLAKISNPASGSAKVSYNRETTSSMPNLVPANNPVQAGFLGDYMWVSVDSKGRPLIVWADTRGLGGTVEEDIYFARGK
jgi:hypothetical protein